LFGIQRRRNIVNGLEHTSSSSSSSNDNSSNRRIVVITGANTGIGFEAAKTLAVQFGYEVILACRSKDKALLAQQSIQQELTSLPTDTTTRTKTIALGKVVVLDPILDLSDFDSIKTYVKALNAKYDKIDVLINNAGRNTSGPSTTTARFRSAGKTPNSPAEQIDLDLLFQSNYLGHFLLTELMLDSSTQHQDGNDNREDDGHRGLLRRGSKVINVSSVMHHFAGGFHKLEKNHGNDKNDHNSRTQITDPTMTTEYWLSHATARDPPSSGVYSASKLAAMLHAIEIRNRYLDHGVDAIVVNPGSVASDIWRSFPSWIRSIFRQVYLTPKQGSLPLVAAAVGSAGVGSGKGGGADDNLNLSLDRINYLQPYWIPPTFGDKPVPPLIEMLGPYVGFTSTTPRLLPNSDDRKTAAKILWNLSHELTTMTTSKH
jgi:NAD(P)-dependent dehydrogenase (short-subunit alcohol dehydrogenase family)